MFHIAFVVSDLKPKKTLFIIWNCNTKVQNNNNKSNSNQRQKTTSDTVSMVCLECLNMKQSARSVYDTFILCQSCITLEFTVCR